MTHWYVAHLFLGETQMLVSNDKKKVYPISGHGESHEDAIEDMGLTAENLDSFKDLAASNSLELKIVVTDMFKYERVLYKPEGL